MSQTTLASAVLLVDDLGAALYRESGELLGRLPEAGAEQPGGWIPELRQLLPAGGEVRLLLDHGALLVQCQEAPPLNPRERRDVVERVFAAERGGESLETAAAQDVDPEADGGSVLWLAAQPRRTLTAWIASLQGAGLVPGACVPLQRALVQGLASLGEGAKDRIVLAVGPGRVGRLILFHRTALVLQRHFGLPEDPTEAEEVVFEEISRLLQFIKQKNRELVFQAVEVLGLPDLSIGLRNRVRGSLRLDLAVLGPELWPVLHEGLQREALRKDALDLLPLEIRQARRRRMVGGLVWTAAGALVLLLAAAGLFLYGQEIRYRREVDQAAQLLANKEAHTAEEARLVEARVPLLRVKLAERRQGRAAAELARVAVALFQAPDGVQLESVEILQLPGDPVGYGFTVTGLAFTENAFSVGPLAEYVAGLGRSRGLVLAPVTQVSVSDRQVEGREDQVERRAVTRFTLKGQAR